MAFSVNQFTGLGNLTRDGELKYTQGGKAVLEFSLAINRRVKDGNEWKDGDPLFLECNVWEGQAEYLAPLMTKGKSVFVVGELRMDTWEDKETGKKRSKIFLVASTAQVGERGEKRERGGNDREDRRDERGSRDSGRGRQPAQSRSFSAGLDDDGPSL